MSVDDSEGKLVIDDLNIDSDPVSINNAHRVERVENFDEIVNEDMDIMDKTSEEKIGPELTCDLLKPQASDYGDRMDIRSKKVMVDKSTCVRAASNPCLGDDLFSIKQGSNLTIDITILCKAGNNVIYILAKWDNKEYHGVITDGEPISHSHSHKRPPATTSNEKDPDAEKSAQNGNKSENERSNKPKIRRPGIKNGDGSQRKRPADMSIYDLNECDEQKRTDLAREDANVNYSSGLCDTPEKYPACCPHRQCDYKFESVTCLNSHLIFDHSTDKNAVLFESVATQTAEVEKRSIGCSTNNLDRSNLRIPFVHEISDEQNSKLSIGSTQNSTSDAKMGILQKSPSEFSDISDDGAPMLEKEGCTELSSSSRQFYCDNKKSGDNIVRPEKNRRMSASYDQSRSSTGFPAPSRKMGIGDIESAMKNKVSPSSSISPRSSMGQIYPHTSVKTTPVSTQSSVDDNAKSNTPHSRENTANTQLFRPTGPTTPLEIFSNNNLILSAFPQFSTAMGNHLASYSPHVSKIGGTPQNPAVTPGRSGHGSGLLSIGTVGTTPAIPFNPSNFLHTGADARLLCSLAPDADLHLNFQNLHKIYELQQHPESSAAASSTSSGMHLSTTGRASATLGVGGAGRSSLSPNLRPSSVSTSTQRIQGIASQGPTSLMKPPNASPCSGPSISMPIGLPTFPGGMLPMQHTPTSNPGQLPPFAQSLLIQQMIQNQNQLRRIGVNPLQLGTQIPGISSQGQLASGFIPGFLPNTNSGSSEKPTE